MDNQVVRFPFKNQSECRMPVGSDYPTGPGWQARSSFGGAKGVACPLAGSSLCSYLAFARKGKMAGSSLQGGESKTQFVNIKQSKCKLIFNISKNIAVSET